MAQRRRPWRYPTRVALFQRNHLIAVLGSVALHAGLLALASGHVFTPRAQPQAPTPAEKIVFMAVVPPPPETPAEAPARTTALRPAPSAPKPALAPVTPATPATPVVAAADDRPRATMDAPPAPTAEEWAFAARYTLKNSKGYRHNWGQQVRSMMGTAVEGVDQGVVRFRVEIAPSGALVRVDTLWSTSPAAERLARQAIEHMPPLPPTPTGQPLVFEKTISFSPFASDAPPVYKDDCLPDPPAFHNPFAWNGKGAATRMAPVADEKRDAQSFEDCQKQLPTDSIEAEAAHDQRQLEQWGSGKLGSR